MSPEAEAEVDRLTRAMFDLDPNLVGEELAEETDRLFRAAMTWAYRDAARVCREMGPRYVNRERYAAAIESRLDETPR